MAERVHPRLEIRLAGAGGQGLQLAARILAGAAILDGRQVAQSQSYEPTSRGGLSRADLVIDDGAIDYPLATALDALVLLDQIAVEASAPLLRPGALVLADSDTVPDPPDGACRLHRLAFAKTARDLGNFRMANLVALGALARLLPGAPAGRLDAAIAEESPPRFVDANRTALAAGGALAEGAG